jgi:hypothetical protein
MSLRCGCAAEGDEIVFGPAHECTVNPKTPADLPRFVPSSWFVVPNERRYEETLSDDAEPGDLG